MKNPKYYLYLNEEETSTVLHSLVQLKNKLIQQDRYTDCVDELILKVMSAPVKKIKKLHKARPNLAVYSAIE